MRDARLRIRTRDPAYIAQKTGIVLLCDSHDWENGIPTHLTQHYLL